MASNRHLGRVIVLQSLYEFELRTLSKDPEVDLDVLTGTLAYLTDTDEDVNVMTLGNVDIEQIEQQRGEVGSPSRLI